MMIASLAAAFLFLAQQQPPAANEAFLIAGTVVDSGTNAPVARAKVVVMPVETLAAQPGVPYQRPSSRSAITGADGTFGFLNVPAGKYQISAALPGRNAQLYLSDGDQYSTAIVTGPGLETSHIVFPFHIGGSMTVDVTDENGDPVRPQVHLFRKAIVDGRERTQRAGAQAAISGGSYHFYHLAPGTYYVAVTAQPWYANNNGLVAPGSAPRARDDLDLAYPLTYYPGTQEFSSATAITVSDGSAANVQIALRAVPSVHLSLPSTADNGKIGMPPRPMSVAAVGPDGMQLPQQAFFNGARSSGIAPGTYIVSTWENGVRAGYREGAHQTIHITGDATLDALASKAPSVVGTTVVDSATKPGNRVMVALLRDGVFAMANAKEDGTFDFKERNLSAGRYRVLLPNNPLFFIKELTASGGSLVDGELDLQDNSSVQLNIVLAQTSQSKLEGIAIHDGKPQPGAMVLLLPVKNTAADAIRRDQSDFDGSFLLPGIPPGTYYLLAIDNGHGLAYRDRTAMKPYLANARSVTIQSSNPPARNDMKIEVQARVAK